MIGKLVCSTKGHDEKKRYIILREDEKYVYISDGRLHTLDKPKKKNKKHIEVLSYDANEIRDQLLRGERITNELIKRTIKLSLHCNKKEEELNV